MRWLPCFFVMFVASSLWAEAVITENSFTDDFSDENIDEYVALDRIGTLLGQPFGAVSLADSALKLSVPSSPVAEFGPSAMLIEQQHINFTDFSISIDILDFDRSLAQIFGVTARTKETGVGTTDGYFASAFLDPTDDNRMTGGINISRFDDEFPNVLAATIGTPQAFAMDPGRDYQLRFSGEGSNLRSQIFDRDDLTMPLATLEISDDTYTSGFSGIFTLGANFLKPTAETTRGDTTFDNYSLSAVPVVEIVVNPVGDIDGDGTVGFSDFLILSAHFGQQGGPEQGDLNGNGVIDFPDFLVISTNFGASVVAAVPEPSGSNQVILLCVGAAMTQVIRKRHRPDHR